MLKVIPRDVNIGCEGVIFGDSTFRYTDYVKFGYAKKQFKFVNM